jgi:hypothetical protein
MAKAATDKRPLSPTIVKIRARLSIVQQAERKARTAGLDAGEVEALVADLYRVLHSIHPTKGVDQSTGKLE